MRYRSKRTYVWSPELAYTVGLVASDGCLYTDQRHLSLVSLDIEQLDNFNAALGRSLRIRPHISGQGRLAHHLQFSDVAYYDFLISAGLTPHKSKTLSTLNVPDELYADFVRGLFDGDGTCYEYIDKRWCSSYLFYCGFTSASLVFLQYLQAKNCQLFGVSKGSLRKSGRAYVLVYAKKDSRRMYASMYYSESLLSLQRKKNKLAGFIAKDSNGILAEH